MLTPEGRLKLEAECKDNCYSASKASIPGMVQFAWKGGKTQHDRPGFPQSGATYHTDGQNLQGERKSAEQREPPSNCLTHSPSLCLSSSGSPLMRWATDRHVTLNVLPVIAQSETGWLKRTLTIEMLFFWLLRYFCWVFLSSSSPPLMDKRMASA